MKYGLLVCKGNGVSKNIGDFIQSIAAKQFYNIIDEYVERENLDDFKTGGEEKVKVIMNGWFLHNPQKWPPSDYILPLFISFHLVPKCEKQIFNHNNIEYFKRYAPIGCRDLNTLRLFQKYDIPSYFSGCLTLTLGNSYKHIDSKLKHLTFVDPYYEAIKDSNGKFSISKTLCNILYGVIAFYKLRKLWHKFEFDGLYNQTNKILKLIKKICCIAAFYRAYSKIFSDKLLYTADYITHNVLNSFKDEKEALNKAENYLTHYENSTLVITSRIHCALPCIAMNTPVVFVTSENLESVTASVRSANRFGGLINLFRIMTYKNNNLTTSDNEILKLFDKNMKISSLEKIFDNKKEYIPIKEKICNECNIFMRC